ncbi:ATP-binding cassette domain-containing protein [Breznakiella homolactica]|uniref:ABC transporter ATP-binding protein n=1 Tax=Breznakiella homolactica TaxID=2798577 RepID=A0A7T7XK45_9SPIR|nr:ABC transporter ATP-binding protein [Breznakiella homolactica]QQO07672.1 ABC transporter ATP-binding protein [Breznakiella homolactica]
MNGTKPSGGKGRVKAEPAIRLERVDKAYGEKPVLRDFSLAINAGEFVTAIGSSGCGKTTVLKLINGLLKPDAGKVFIQGKDIAGQDRDRLRRRMGYAIQGVGLFPHRKVRDNITYVPELNKVPREERRRAAAELAELVRLDRELLDRYPHELSGGQRQRVGLARALAAKPEIVLMDEPFGAVDDITRKSLQEEIKGIHRRTGVTIFFITHDISEALSLGTRVLVMDQGVIHQFDTPRELRRRPATAFTAELVGGAGKAI